MVRGRLKLALDQLLADQRMTMISIDRVVKSLKEPMHSASLLHSRIHHQPSVRVVKTQTSLPQDNAASRRGTMQSESSKSPTTPPPPPPPAATSSPTASPPPPPVAKDATSPVTSPSESNGRTLWEDRPANKQPGRNSGSQLSFLMPHHGGNLFSWGLPEARIARKGGDNSIPQVALPDLKVISIAASRHSAIATSSGHVYTMVSLILVPNNKP